MHHEDSTAKHEVRRAKQLAARFELLQREIAALDPLPSMDPSLELDPATRAIADEWLTEHLDANVGPTPSVRAPNGLRG